MKSWARGREVLRVSSKGGGGAAGLTCCWSELIFSGLSRRCERQREVEAPILPAVHFLEPEEPGKKLRSKSCKPCSCRYAQHPPLYSCCDCQGFLTDSWWCCCPDPLLVASLGYFQVCSCCLFPGCGLTGI